MNRRRLAGILWLIAGISSGAIAFFILDPLTLAVFIVGAVLGVLLGIALLARPQARLTGLAAAMGVLWLVAFGAASVGNLSAPIEELLSVIWVLAFGAAGGLTAYLAER